jgi:hypothetical protein
MTLSTDRMKSNLISALETIFSKAIRVTVTGHIDQRSNVWQRRRPLEFAILRTYFFASTEEGEYQYS